nr:ankyrin repeat-containing protein BDA1-like [Quercus suber]
MGERIVKLNEVAQQGNIEAFYGIIQEDVKLLENIDELPFVDTPLHVAASAVGPQHVQFAMEMMRLKPSFARKPDLNGYSPIHLALQEGHTQMVRWLLQVDGDLVRVKGNEGRTPLHDVAAAAATEQQLDLLFKFLSDCLNSIEDVTIQNQPALHIALEKNKLDAFKRMVRWLRKNKSENAREILNWQDEKGNTVLQVAKSKKQTEAVRELRNCCVIFERLRLLIKTAREGARISSDDRNALLVVAALLLTVTYQAALSPPGGLWQEDKISEGHSAGTAIARTDYTILWRQNKMPALSLDFLCGLCVYNAFNALV